MPPQKRGFFQRINPLNLLSGGSPKPAPTALKTADSKQPMLIADARENTRSREARYHYRYPSRPIPGDRSAAQTAFAQGVRDQAARKLPDAVQAYRKAIQLDPAFFEAHYNLGLALATRGDFLPALAAYEDALAARPNSLDARYNLALTLGQAGYAVDSAAEFDTLLMSYPKDIRAHLALANVYAQQLKDPARARKEYAKVLELDPRHPQAAVIKQWLANNP